MSQSPLSDTEWEVTREFWAAAARSELVVPRCSGCERYVWYPREKCPDCRSTEMPWTQVSGRGKLFSYSWVERPLYKAFAEKVPYLTGLVSLEEDPRVRMVTLLVDCVAEELKMDMPMKVSFRDLEFSGVEGAVMAPFFCPAK